MAKRKSNAVFTRKRHSLPYSTLETYRELNKLEFVTDKVRLAWFWNASTNKKNEIVGFDCNTRCYVLTITKRHFGQRLFIPVNEDKEDYRTAINKCLPKNYFSNS